MSFRNLSLVITLGLVMLLSHQQTMAQESVKPHPQETRALQLKTEAETAVASENFAKAVAALKEAIRLVPDDFDTHYQLAQTLLAADRLPEMWRVLRSAALKVPNHPDVARGLLSYWKMFDEQGLFNANVPLATVEKVLGQPDHRIQGPDRVRLIYGFIAIESKHGNPNVHQTLDLRGVTNEHLSPREFVEIELDGKGRSVGHRTVNKVSTTAEYVLPGEQVQEWTELFSVQRLHNLGRSEKPIREIAKGILDSLAQEHPGRWFSVLRESKDDILFEWSIDATERTTAQHEIVRLIRGSVDVHRIAFVVRQTQMQPAQRDQWLGILTTARLRRVLDKERADPAAANKPVTLSKRPDSDAADLAAWRLGHHLSLAVFGHARRMEEIAKPNLLKSLRLAQEFDAQLAPPFAQTDDTMQNMIAAVDYLFHKMLPALSQRMTDQQLATYEVVAYSHALNMFVADENLKQKSLRGMNQALPRTNFPQALLAALNERAANGADNEQLRTIIQKLHADVALIFQQRQTRAGEQAKAGQIASRVAKPSTVSQKDGDRKVSETQTISSQVLTISGSKVGEITADGEVWISGEKVGNITQSGQIWVAGEKEGELTDDGEVWKAGNKIGDVTGDGEVWLEGEQVGSIEDDGEVWRNGNRIGYVKGGDPRSAAVILFFGFFDLEE